MARRWRSAGPGPGGGRGAEGRPRRPAAQGLCMIPAPPPPQPYAPRAHVTARRGQSAPPPPPPRARRAAAGRGVRGSKDVGTVRTRRRGRSVGSGTPAGSRIRSSDPLAAAGRRSASLGTGDKRDPASACAPPRQAAGPEGAGSPRGAESRRTPRRAAFPGRSGAAGPALRPGTLRRGRPGGEGAAGPGPPDSRGHSGGAGNFAVVPLPALAAHVRARGAPATAMGRSVPGRCGGTRFLFPSRFAARREPPLRGGATAWPRPLPAPEPAPLPVPAG
ncbi:collagen alpha-1(III) chain-like [Vidua chalybeata]|uniref:collagen alpha-1(III) chain-like n=1 Tax=Vidua chalybeata TaxID=81927 RepID=UPI0023A7F169|nr:collagen alpha-1(III) chain-like [Vidua chalybeata]